MIDARAGTLPLAGRTIAVTRPAERAASLVRALEALGADVIACAAIAIEPPASYDALDAALARIAEFHWLALTSVAAADAVADRLHATARTLGDVRIASVGEATAAAARARLVRCDLVPRLQTADGLAAALPLAAGARVLFPCADRARDALPIGLRRRGAHVECVVAYRTATRDDAMDDVAHRAVDAALLASPSAARALARALGRVGAAVPRLVCIGPATAHECRALGFDSFTVATTPSDEGLVDATVRCLSNGCDPQTSQISPMPSDRGDEPHANRSV